jgi:hypothetical protein
VVSFHHENMKIRDLHWHPTCGVEEIDAHLKGVVQLGMRLCLCVLAAPSHCPCAARTMIS